MEVGISDLIPLTLLYVLVGGVELTPIDESSRCREAELSQPASLIQTRNLLLITLGLTIGGEVYLKP